MQKRHLNAYLQVYDEEALQLAAQLDAQRAAGKPLGKLHGVVIALKDVICYKDHPVSAASKILGKLHLPLQCNRRRTPPR